MLTYLLLLSFGSLYAQDSAYIKGRILDRDQHSLIGAIIQIEGTTYQTVSNDLGYYRLRVPAGQVVQLFVSFYEHNQRKTIAPLDPGREYRVDFVLNAVFEIRGVVTSAQRVRVDVPSEVIVSPKALEGFPTPSGIEQSLKSIALGVSASGGELSSGYNVRGGNFDENLVYINDIEVYRPFLARSGQQEGLSIINPDMVERIHFSSGGFSARYGDKLSSVLDIKLRQPDSTAGTVHLSLLGVNGHWEGKGVQNRLTYVVGARYRSNQYLLGSLDVQGDYKPRFVDLQALTRFRIKSDMDLEWYSSFAQNRYLVVPQTQTTNFGNVNQAISLTVAFGGQELMRYNTWVNGLKLSYVPSPKLHLQFLTSAYATNEREYFTVEGAFRLDELENNLGAQNFAEVRQNLGLGYYIDHARNDLNAQVYSIGHKGTYRLNVGKLQWGWTTKFEGIQDRLKEWRYNDSSGYNINTFNSDKGKDQILLDEYLKADISLNSNRHSAFLLHELDLDSIGAMHLNYGVRTSYWSYNGQNVISPRAQFVYRPNKRFNDSLAQTLSRQSQYDSLSLPDWTFKLAAGVYYQPPFYRELRNLDGQLNPALRAQRSIHFVLGGDRSFTAWGRPFKWITEVYYKHLDDMVPYVIDNVRIRYLADNISKGYATGLDTRVNGEFIQGVESWFNFSLLSTRERILTDKDGQKEYSDWLRRPTDQLVNFSILFQDELPSNPSYKMNLSLIFGSRLPFYFDAQDRTADGFRIPPYRRVDIGFSKQVFAPGSGYRPSYLKHARSLWVSLEVFNLLEVNNTISFTLLKDYSNRIYGVPNYLTGRRLNLRMILKI